MDPAEFEVRACMRVFARASARGGCSRVYRCRRFSHAAHRVATQHNPLQLSTMGCNAIRRCNAGAARGADRAQARVRRLAQRRGRAPLGRAQGTQPQTQPQRRSRNRPQHNLNRKAQPHRNAAHPRGGAASRRGGGRGCGTSLTGARRRPSASARSRAQTCARSTTRTSPRPRRAAARSRCAAAARHHRRGRRPCPCRCTTRCRLRCT